MFFNSTFSSQSIIRIDQINFLQLWNSIIKIGLGIFKYLISIYRNAQLQSIIQIVVVIFKWLLSVDSYTKLQSIIQIYETNYLQF